MKIIKTLDLSKNAPFQLFKEEKEDFLYLISIVLKERKNNNPSDGCIIAYIEAIKFDLDLNIIKNQKLK